MNTAHSSFYQVCRLCLLELNGSSVVPIFDNKDSNLPQKIRACFTINVEEADRLPNVLCTACARDVERFYKFKEKVVKNNAFLRSYVSQRDKKAAQFLSRGDDGSGQVGPAQPTPTKAKRGGASSTASAMATKGRRTASKKTDAATYQEASDNPLNNFDNCELSNQFFDNSKKVKVEIIPQVDNDMYSGLKHDVVEMWSDSPTEESSSSSGFRTIKSLEEARAVASITDPDQSASKSPEYATSVIRHSSDDYGNGSSSYDQYISVHVKEEVCKEDGAEEYDSEDTKSAASLTFHEEEDKLIIDEETMEVRQFVNVPSNETMITEEGVRTSDNCILLRTLISTANAQPLRSGRVTGTGKRPATFSPQILVSEMHSPGGDGSEKNSTRRKQRCPTKSAHEQAMAGIVVADESEEENAELSTISEHHQNSVIYQQEIVNISPVTVTCSSNGREEIVGYNQTQFLDEVLSRHSSPATSPPMVGPSQAERLHKACDVLLRAASKIQDLPPGIQQEEVVVEEEESITLYPTSSQMGDGQGEQITIRHNPVPLYEISFSSVNANNEGSRPPKKVKSREKVQNVGSGHKECNNCHAVQTTIWRRDRFGNIVCNACGLYYKLHNYDRPCRMRRDEIHKRNRKKNANENKGKKVKRNSNGNFELDSSREQDNSSGSYTPPAGSFNDSSGHVSMADLYNNLSGSGGIKKRRRASTTNNSITTVMVKEEQLEVFQEQEHELQEHELQEHELQEHELQAHIDNVEEIGVNGTEVVEEEALENHVYDEEEQVDEEKLNSMSEFQLSTHFVPINGKAYEEEDYSNENPMNETPLNLAAGSQISN